MQSLCKGLNELNVQRVALWGIGKFARSYLPVFKEQLPNIVCILDDYCPFDSFKKIPIIKPDSLDELPQFDVIIMSVNIEQIASLRQRIASDKKFADIPVHSWHDSFAQKTDIDSHGQTFVLYPVFESTEEMAIEIYRAAHYLGQNDGQTIIVPVSDTLSEENLDVDAIVCPSFYEKISLPESIIKFMPGCEFNEAMKQGQFLDACSLIWDRTASGEILLVLHSFTVDRKNDADSEGVYSQIHLRANPAPSQAEQVKNEIKTWHRFINTQGHFRKVYVLGTGPSLQDAYNHDFSDGIRIVCNTIVKDKKLCKFIDPHLIFAADPLYHLSPVTYASTFRDDLIDILTRFPELLVVSYARFMPMIHQLFPENLHSRFVGLDIRNKTLDFPATTNLKVKGMHNILTSMLQVASYLGNEIHFLGFDGRPDKENRFWNSDNRHNYEELKVDLESAVPGFFKCMDYEEYFQLQCYNAELIMAHGEQLGKLYKALMPSTNPAFSRRYV